MKGLCVLGATGSVGRSTLDVAARSPEHWRIETLTAHRDAEGMAELVGQYRPARVVMADPQAADRLRQRLGATASCEVLAGAEALSEVVTAGEVDTVMAAIVGAAGLAPTLAAAHAAKRVALATKEALVTAGDLLMRAVSEQGAVLLPVDSEHNAIFQCLPSSYVCGRRPAEVRRLVLTASGGPFLDWSWDQMRAATPAQAVAHPNWDMGQKISVDSATMMNKGLELIEAAYLFAMPASDIDIIVHRQSVVHSLVEYVDGSFLAQLGSADMRIPIAHALMHPERSESGAERLDLASLGQLDFSQPDEQKFPALTLARQALEAGPPMPAVLNAANEVAVARFLRGEMGFTDIAALVADVMDEAGAWSGTQESLEAVLDTEQRARERAEAWSRAVG